jgi:hypothetical protein
MWLLDEAYRSEHGVHEPVRLLGLHEPLHLEHANGQTGYNGGMLFERLFQYFAIAIIVIQRPDLLDTTEALKGSMIELVDVGEVRVGDDDIGESLDVAQTMGYPGLLQRGSAQGDVCVIAPRGQLQPAVVGRVYQTRFGQSAAEEGQLP